MTIDEAIKNLQDAKARGVKSIVLAYWESEGFGLPDDQDWQALADLVEHEMDWSGAHEDINTIIKDKWEE